MRNVSFYGQENSIFDIWEQYSSDDIISTLVGNIEDIRTIGSDYVFCHPMFSNNINDIGNRISTRGTTDIERLWKHLETIVPEHPENFSIYHKQHVEEVGPGDNLRVLLLYIDNDIHCSDVKDNAYIYSGCRDETIGLKWRLNRTVSHDAPSPAIDHPLYYT
jgi:hypothetical protein